MYQLSPGRGEHEIPVSANLPSDPFARLYGSDGSVRLSVNGMVVEYADTIPMTPPSDFDDLVTVYQESCILPQCGDALAEFVEGQGYELAEREGVALENQPDKAQQASRVEKRRLEYFLRTAAGSEHERVSWTQMLRRSRQDYEVMAWRAFEVLCVPAPPGKPEEVDPLGTPTGVEHIDASTLRWCGQSDQIEMSECVLEYVYDDADPEVPPVPVYRTRKVFRRFRLIVQSRASNEEAVYYRQFGDPRIIHCKSGAVLGRYDMAGQPGYDERGVLLPLVGAQRTNAISLLGGEAAQDEISPRYWANELLVQVRYFPKWGPYGRPWWYGVCTVSEALSAAESANWAAIDHPKIPRVIVTAEGKETKADLERLQEQVDQRDDPAAHSEMLLLETEPWTVGDLETGEARLGRGAMNVHQISVLPDQGLFKDFDDQGRTKVRSARGLSSMSVGLSDEYTFASARAALLVEDKRVLAPERMDLDEMVERLMCRLRARFWEYRTKRLQVVSPDESAQSVANAETGGGMTPNAHRALLEQSLGVKLPKITEPWGDQPFTVTMETVKAAGGMMGAQEGGVPGEEGGSSEVGATKGTGNAVVCAVRNLRDALVAMKRAGGHEGHGHG